MMENENGKIVRGRNKNSGREFHPNYTLPFSSNFRINNLHFRCKYQYINSA
jgi:hypothetical protein